MGIEEDLFSAMKHARLQDPNEIMRTMVLNMLNSMKSQIDTMSKTFNAMGQDPYSVLGVKQGSTYKEVNAAYRHKAKKVHPDANGTAEQMAVLNRAYAMICKQQGWR